MTKRKCPFCEKEIEANLLSNHTHIATSCDVCGGYCFDIFDYAKQDRKLRDKIAAYLFYHKKDKDYSSTYYFIGSKSFYESEYSDRENVKYVSIEEIENWYPKTFSEKIDRIVLYLAEHSHFFGDKTICNIDQIASLCFFNRNDETDDLIYNQLNFFIEIFNKNELVEIILPPIQGMDEYELKITPTGWKRVDELQKHNSKNSKTVFIAMSFAENMKEVRESIKAAVIENGYIPRIMDEIEHNHQIVPEMLYEIRQAKFVIAELTGHNNGAYFEAGYALGNGKEVIQICNNDKFGTDGHFDVKQINTILWDTTEELTQKLSARIKATIM